MFIPHRYLLHLNRTTVTGRNGTDKFGWEFHLQGTVSISFPLQLTGVFKKQISPFHSVLCAAALCKLAVLAGDQFWMTIK